MFFKVKHSNKQRKNKRELTSLPGNLTYLLNKNPTLNIPYLVAPSSSSPPPDLHLSQLRILLSQLQCYFWEPSHCVHFSVVMQMFLYLRTVCFSLWNMWMVATWCFKYKKQGSSMKIGQGGSGYNLIACEVAIMIWAKIFKNGESKICGRQPHHLSLIIMSLQIF